MEISNQQPDSVTEHPIIKEQVKNQKETNSSEDEGIFLSHNANSAMSHLSDSAPMIHPNSHLNPTVMLSEESDEDDIIKPLSITRRKLAVLSDEEDEVENKEATPVMTKCSKIIMSDIEEDDGDIFQRRFRQHPTDDDSESSNLNENDIHAKHVSGSSGSSPIAKPKYKYNSNIFDTETSDDDNQDKKNHYPKEEEFSNKKKKKPTAKEREEEVRSIHSESQRMVRESEISLPYHRPKQRSLSEFLSRRKKATPPQLMSRCSIKMSMRKIETLSLLEQKKKEVEEFYKSDSDLDDDDDPKDRNWTPDLEHKDSVLEPKSEQTDIAVEKVEQASDGLEKFDTNNKEGVVLEYEGADTRHCLNDNPTDKAVSAVSAADDDDEELPDLIVERVPKSFIEDSVAERATDSLENDNGKASGESPGDTCCKVNDSGLHSSTPSPIEELPLEKYNASEEKEPVQNENPSEELLCVNEVDTNACKKYANEEVIGNNKISENLEMAFEDLEKSPDNLTTCVTSNLISSETPKLNKLATKIPDFDFSKLAVSTPKLSVGSNDDFIDLEEDIPVVVTPKNVSGVYDLMNRFVKHSNTRRQPVGKQQVKLSIVSSEKDDSGKEKLVASDLYVNLEAKEEREPGDPVPGAPMVKLKSALQAKIRERREQGRIRRLKEKEFLENEQVFEDYHDVGNLPNEEEEMTDQSDTEYETESEPEENDIIIKDKKRKKNAYFDDEAEEEDDDDEAKEGEGNESGSEDDEERDDVRDIGDDDESNNTVKLPDLHENDTEEDKDDDDLKLHLDDTQDVVSMSRSTSLARTGSLDQDIFTSQSVKKVESLEKDTSVTSMDSSFELFGSVIPAHQPGGGLKRATIDKQRESEYDTGFLTPLMKSKSNFFGSSVKERDLSLPIENSQDLFNMSSSDSPSPFTSSNCQVNLRLTPVITSQLGSQEESDAAAAAKLKLDFNGTQTSQQIGDDLLELCSGKFTEAGVPRIDDLCQNELSPTQDINDLVGLCSGQFTDQSDKESSNTFKIPSFTNIIKSNSKPQGVEKEDDELLNLCSGRFERENNGDSESSNVEAIKNVNGDGDIDNDSLDEPEMVVDSSDDERDKQNRPSGKRIKKKRRRIIAFSDDEDAQDAIDYSDDAQDALEYDDEENEVPRTTFSGFKDRSTGGIRADFLENEAELSDTDHDYSDDEDERGQDVLDEEEGDIEEYDEEDLRNQVGRAHLKSLLDSDKREVRLLQEMYLEDGELHGEGRQRQFRWRNVDDDDTENKITLSDNEEGDEDETEDAAWRKERFEREKFLLDQKEKADYNEGGVLKLAKKPLMRTISKSLEPGLKREPLKEANPTPSTTAPAASEGLTANPYSVLRKRGSFLSRDKNTLARIAELTKDKSTVGAAKQSGNFVFQHLSAEEVQVKVESSMTLKKSHSVPASKRAKLDRSFFSMDSSSQSCSIFSHIK